jgi:hypothetical protein
MDDFAVGPLGRYGLHPALPKMPDALTWQIAVHAILAHPPLRGALCRHPRRGFDEPIGNLSRRMQGAA